VNPLLAHGIGGVRDLPVPEWLFMYGAALVLIVSFVALALLWERPLLAKHADGRPLPEGVQSFVFWPTLRIAGGAISAFLLFVVIIASFTGTDTPRENFAPVFVYVVFWLGLVAVVVVLGNVWPALNPWKAVADGFAWISERFGSPSEPMGRYPERWSRWPAAVQLFLFAALELAYFDPSNPRALGTAIVLYSLVQWFGAAWFGREAWFTNAEAFSVYFALLAHIAPLAVRTGDDGERELVLRPPLVGLTRLATPPGTIAFVAVMLGSVGFDGFSRTSWWLDRREDIRNAAPGSFDLTGTLLNTVGLALAVAAVALAYLLAVAIAKRLARTDKDLVHAFVGSLIPIALVYAVSHYFSLLIGQGQVAIRLASDPLGEGWNLFGTADMTVDLTPLSPNTIWYVQVTALLAGHVAGLMLAHDRAVELFPSSRQALRTQYPFLVLMVLYTVGGLWLLSQG
jgi:hypothetical protein